MKSLKELKEDLDILLSLYDNCEKLSVNKKFVRADIEPIINKLVDVIKEKLNEINNELK